MEKDNSHNKDSGYILGIDTSNYTTSMALIDFGGSTVCDSRKMLTVKQGEKGLRQSYALFQHIDNLPEITERLINKNNDISGSAGICAVAVSSRPRPVEGSYMPVFKAGLSFAQSIAAINRIPCFEFSHQEGHIEAVKNLSVLDNEKEILAFHLSGGTCELLSVRSRDPYGYDIEIIGGTKDISFGQLFDRIGVYLGFDFPAGGSLDKIVSEYNFEHSSGGRALKKLFKPVHTDGLYFNLSGLETGFKRNISIDSVFEEKAAAIYEIFRKTADCLIKITEKAVNETGITSVLFSGGVSSSLAIRNFITDYFKGKNISIVFGDPDLSKDNAVGIALLGRKALVNNNGSKTN